jgi:hypothetical protein
MNDAVIESASCGQIRSKLSCKPEGVVVIESQDREDEEKWIPLALADNLRRLAYQAN